MAKFPSILHSRNTSIERIKPFMRTPIVKVMIGHRRVGKSYILFQLIELIKSEEQNANIIYINKENIDFVNITFYQNLHDYISARLVSNRKNYIFVDEIQEITDYKVAGHSQCDCRITATRSRKKIEEHCLQPPVILRI